MYTQSLVIVHNSIKLDFCCKGKNHHKKAKFQSIKGHQHFESKFKLIKKVQKCSALSSRLEFAYRSIQGRFIINELYKLNKKKLFFLSIERYNIP